VLSLLNRYLVGARRGSREMLSRPNE